MKSLSLNAAAMQPSGIREIAEQVFARTARGEGPFISLTAGEPNFRAAPWISKAAQETLENGHMGYIENGGIWPLREALADKCTARHGVETVAAEILVSIGAMGCLSSSCMALFDAGDEVLVPDPGYPNYGMIFALLGVKLVPYDCPAAVGFQPDLDDLRSKITAKTQAILVCNPSNPTGAVIPAATLDAFAAIARQADVWLLSDEIYEDLVFDAPFASLVPRAPERTLYYSGFSKAYAMTGYRVGFMRGPASLVKVISDMHEALMSCGVSATQVAALAALKGDQSRVEEMRLSYKRRRDLVVEMVRARGLATYVPGGAFYLMLPLPGLPISSRDFALSLLETSKVAVAPGGAFGESGEAHVRLSLATEKTALLTGVERLLDHYVALVRK